MNSYNLFSPNGLDPLRYPHYTRWRSNEVLVVTDKNIEINVGDEIFVAQESKNLKGQMEYAYFHKPRKVLSIVEQRKAKGKHRGWH